MEETNVPQQTAEQVKQALDAGEACILLDVRTPEEYARNRIPGSINVRVEEVEGKIAGVIPDRTARVYVYCLSGSRSMYAVAAMRNLGYTNVFDMGHGLLAWRVKGYPINQ